jgi:thiamine-phosphate pyrophosphorylase
MIILFSPPGTFPNEAEHINRMLEQHPLLTFHLRKPEADRVTYEKNLGEIKPEFHPRVVLHQHHELSDFYDVKGVHFTERHRAEHTLHPKVVSTSFHTLTDAQNAGMVYDYFFCSPVFPSISKHGYEPSETWNITNDSETFREKAVALGGIDRSRLPQVKAKGFRHIALLGAVWQVSDPAEALGVIYRDS